MSEEELLKFREDLLNDPELAGEFQLHELIDQTLEQHDEVRFRGKLQGVLQHQEKGDRAE